MRLAKEEKTGRIKGTKPAKCLARLLASSEHADICHGKALYAFPILFQEQSHHDRVMGPCATGCIALILWGRQGDASLILKLSPWWGEGLCFKVAG